MWWVLLESMDTLHRGTAQAQQKENNRRKTRMMVLVARTFGSLDCKVDTQVATAADSDAQEMRPIQTIDALAGRPLS